MRGLVRRWVAVGGRESVEIMALNLVSSGYVAMMSWSLAAAAPPGGGGSGLPVFPLFACIGFMAWKETSPGLWKTITKEVCTGC